MSTKGLFPFMLSVAESTDINMFKETGFYRLAGSSFTNGPTSSMYGILVVFKDATSYRTQIALSLLGTPRVFVRGGSFLDNTWAGWKEVSLL